MFDGSAIATNKPFVDNKAFFTNEDLTNTGLFATILADTQVYGYNFISIVQMKSNFFLKYMITSFLISRGQPSQKYQIKNDSLETLAL